MLWGGLEMGLFDDFLLSLDQMVSEALSGGDI